MTEFCLRDVRLIGRPGEICQVIVADGRIRAINTGLPVGIQGPAIDGGGRLLFPGFVESHVHLDKGGIMDRCEICQGTLEEAVQRTAHAKAAFTVEDIAARARAMVHQAVGMGTTRMRSFVELDPRVGTRALEALQQVQAETAHLLDLELCAFAQEGITQEPETLSLLRHALARGVAAIGGCPYTDADPARHIEIIFELAREFDVPADFHVDFDLDPKKPWLPEILRQTRVFGWQGRVSVGHATKLAMMPPEALNVLGQEMRDAGVTLTVLPATDLFLNGRDHDHGVPRGIAPALELAMAGVPATVSTNNVLNPFTPYGDLSLPRLANLYANVAQAGTAAQMTQVFDMVSAMAETLLGRPRQIEVGAPATFILLDAVSPADAVARIAPALAGWKDGRQTFRHPAPEVFDHRPTPLGG